jgi:hypothetical protein
MVHVMLIFSETSLHISKILRCKNTEDQRISVKNLTSRLLQVFDIQQKESLW